MSVFPNIWDELRKWLIIPRHTAHDEETCRHHQRMMSWKWRRIRKKDALTKKIIITIDEWRYPVLQYWIDILLSIMQHAETTTYMVTDEMKVLSSPRYKENREWADHEEIRGRIAITAQHIPVIPRPRSLSDELPFTARCLLHRLYGYMPLVFFRRYDFRLTTSDCDITRLPRVLALIYPRQDWSQRYVTQESKWIIILYCGLRDLRHWD